MPKLITLVNTQFGASNIRTVLGYIWGADSKNDIGFFASALVFELRHTPIILTFICYTWILSNKEFFKDCLKVCQMRNSKVTTCLTYFQQHKIIKYPDESNRH